MLVIQRPILIATEAVVRLDGISTVLQAISPGNHQEAYRTLEQK